MMNFDLSAPTLLICSIAALSAGLLLVGVQLVLRMNQQSRKLRKIDAVLATRTAKKNPDAVNSAARAAKSSPWERVFGTAIDSRLGKALVAEEDRRLLDQCGLNSASAQAGYFGARAIAGIGLPLLAWLLLDDASNGSTRLFFLMAALVAGVLGPKWFLRHRAGQRRDSVVNELPLLVDLLRLLQGVGLSLDQSLQVVVTDFMPLLPVLGVELDNANRQFATGRTRQQSLQHLATTYDNEDLAAIVRLLVQVDRHGGAVQEPLKQFGDRMREHRRSSYKEKIGKLNVKMTGTMVLTLLPALLIVVAGPGFLAVIRSLTRLGSP